MQELSGSDGNVLCLDLGVAICQNLSNYTLHSSASHNI